MITIRAKVVLLSTVASCALVAGSDATGAHRNATSRPESAGARVDAIVMAAMKAVASEGLALAIVEKGQVTYVHTYGVRNATGEPLEVDTVMYAASLTKAVFATFVMQLADEKLLDLDTPIEGLLPRALPTYTNEPGFGHYGDLAADSRWKQITPRMLLSHRAGFANFAFLEPDQKLRIHFDPGTRYAYSGEGLILLQFVIERGLGLNVGSEMQRRLFEPLGMRNTGMTWRADFARNLADGFAIDGAPRPHEQRSRVRAAGSMDTTIEDFSLFAAAFVSGSLTSADSRRAMVKSQWPITTLRQFPTLEPEVPVRYRRKDLATGLGVIVFDGPQGAGFYKGGHDDVTGNQWICLERGLRCIVLLSNDVRTEAAYPKIVRAVLGDTGMPWSWEFGGT
jgi:CubicO group peptidase (beta-lactamase class C family)